MTRFADIAGALVAAGYSPIPIQPNAKAPAVSAWTEYTYTADDARKFRTCGVGLLCGELRAIDIDVRNEQVSARIETLAKTMLNIDGKAPRRIGQWPKTLLMVRSDHGVKMATHPYRFESEMMDDKPHKVEILGAGQQFVAYGVHPDTGREYTWNGAGDPTTVTFDSLPYVDPAELHAFISAAEEILAEYGVRCGKLGRDEYGTLHQSAGDLSGDYLTVASALRHIPNADLSRDDWIVVGMALKGALGEQGRSLWLEWSRSSTKSGMSGKSDSPERAWDSFKPTKIGAGTIYYEAKKRGWVRPAQAVPDIPDYVQDVPPLEAYEPTITAPEDRQADKAERKDGHTLAEQPKPIDWAALENQPIPKREWVCKDWIGYYPTLFSGKGSAGKSLLMQQWASSIAIGRSFVGEIAEPKRVLYWACEEDQEELHRRQVGFSRHMRHPLSGFLPNFLVVPRLGCENTLYTTEYGRPMWTPMIEMLRQQVNDTAADVLILDNIGHVFGANENARHDVTAFINGLYGLVCGRKFSLILIGHPAKSEGSEFAGSGAWENAVRMRWYLGDSLPGEKRSEDDEGDVDPNSQLRFLCKRKTNYSAQDYVRFVLADGVFKPEELDPDTTGVYGQLRRKKAAAAILDGIRALARMGKHCSEAKGQNYLPALLAEYNLLNNCTRGEVADAMRHLMTDGKLKREVVGHYANRAPRYGLVIVE